MFRLASLFVEIGANTQGLNTALAGIHARLLGMGSIGQAASKGLHSLAMGFGALEGAIGGLGISIAVGLGVAVVTALAKCAMLAGHLTEAIGLTERTFGVATPKMLAMADELAAKFGVVKTEILGVAASYGKMLQGAGLKSDISAEMSEALTRRAVDISKDFDIPISEATQRMQSGLAGEMEAVRRMGVNLSEANIKRQGLAMGFGGGELSQDAKTLIRYKIIMQQTSSSAGAAAKEQSGLVAQWDIFTGTLTRLGTIVGELVVPWFTFWLTVINTSLTAITGLLEWTWGLSKQMIAWIGSMFGYDLGGGKETAARRKAESERIAKSEEQIKKDEDAAKLAEAEQGKAKGWRGGLDEFSKKVQEGAWGGGKHKVAQDQLKTQQAMEKLLEEIKKNTRPAGSPPPPIPSFP